MAKNADNFCSNEYLVERHIVEEPISIQCGHVVCRKCTINKDTIQCSKCGKISNIENINKPNVLRSNLQLQLQQLFDIVNESVKDVGSKCKDKAVDLYERICCQLEYMRYEIDIRVESMKEQLDRLGQSFHEELNIYEDKLKVQFRENEEHLTRIEDEVSKMTDTIANTEVYSDASFNDCKQKLMNLNSKLEEIKCFDFKVTFEEGTGIDKNAIGFIHYSFEKLTSRINFYEPKGFDLICYPYHIGVLQNENVLVVNRISQNRLSLYDSNFQFIRNIDEINLQNVCPNALTSNDSDTIIITDCTNHRLFALTNDFAIRNTFGSLGSDQHELNDPYDACFYNDSIYICDYGNSRIQKLSKILTYESTFFLPYNPMEIKIINDIACVRSPTSIFFYELPSFNQLYFYNGHNGCIWTYQSFFYEYYNANQKFYCYDKNGRLIEEIQTNFGNNINAVRVLKGRLVFCSSQRLIVI